MLLKGKIEKKQGKLDQAIDSFQNALQTSPYMFAAIKELVSIDPKSMLSQIIFPDENNRFISDCQILVKGYTLYKNNDFQAAMKVIEEKEKYDFVVNLKAKAFLKMLKFQESLKEFKKFVYLCPFDTRVYVNYSTLLWHLSDLNELKRVSDSLMKKDKSSMECLVTTANYLSLKDDHSEAIRILERAISEYPNEHNLFSLMAHELVQDSKLEEATVV